MELFNPRRKYDGVEILIRVDQHFIAPIQIREQHPRLHHTSAASGDIAFPPSRGGERGLNMEGLLFFFEPSR